MRTNPEVIDAQDQVIPNLTALLSQPGTVLLDAARPDAENPHTYVFADPQRELTATALQDIPVLLGGLDKAVAQGKYVAGYLGYEAGFAFEDIAPFQAGSVPLGWFGVYDPPLKLSADAVRQALASLEVVPCTIRDAKLNISREAYRAKIDAIRAHIREGDVYQVNFTDRIDFVFEGSAIALYRALRERQPVAFGAFIQRGDSQVLCLSPELFFRRAGRQIETRPMKGTVRRGKTHAEDEALRRWLAADPKSQAENLMIVDLLRNDLSVCCEPGSVAVKALYETEVYRTLIQMTSTVEGRLRDGIEYADLFEALFPCGSVTGAPKIRAMQLIDDLEDGPRGVYCGAIGYAAPEHAVFNVAIRTVVLRDGQGTMGTGSGIVWDSDADAEYDECRLKAQFLTSIAHSHDFKLIETMRWEAERILLLDLHAERIRASAAYFGFAFDPIGFSAAIQASTAGLPHDLPHKVRVTLDERGRFEASAEMLQEAPFRHAVLHETPVDSEDVFFYHKTTNRFLYETAYQQAQAAGFDEAILLNEHGELTEGTRTNLFIRQGESWLTPPVASGLLSGVYRQHLLDTLPDVEERVLYETDLHEAHATYLCNAVRGLCEITVASKKPA